MQIWSRTPQNLEGRKPSYSTVWDVVLVNHDTHITQQSWDSSPHTEGKGRTLPALWIDYLPRSGSSSSLPDHREARDPRVFHPAAAQRGVGQQNAGCAQVLRVQGLSISRRSHLCVRTSTPGRKVKFQSHVERMTFGESWRWKGRIVARGAPKQARPRICPRRYRALSHSRWPTILKWTSSRCCGENPSTLQENRAWARQLGEP